MRYKVKVTIQVYLECANAEEAEEEAKRWMIEESNRVWHYITDVDVSV